jgi:ubiquinone biosynthesis protein COQ9
MAKDDDVFAPVRDAILCQALKAAAFDGFTPLGLERAARAAGRSKAELAAAFPGGPADLLAYWSAKADEAAAAAVMAPHDPPLRIREKVARGVEARLGYLRLHKEAARRAAAHLALPHNAPRAARLVWATADVIWRAIGDPSTDFNFYSKRAILSGVWSATFARWLADDSADETATRTFLAARIDNVMQFEKFKSRVRDSGFNAESLFGWLAKARYPDRR